MSPSENVGEAGASPAAPTPGEAVAQRIEQLLRPTIADVAVNLHQGYSEVYVPPEQLVQAATAVRDHLGYVYLSMVTAVDYADRIEVVYLAFSLDHPHGIFLKSRLPREDLPECPSLTSVWPGAEFQEREVYDLMGVNFVGHPDLRRILTEDDFPGHPLRKDFHIEPDYVLMRHLRHGAEGQLAPQNPTSDPG